MKRAVAFGLIGLVLLETPRCGNSGGSGDINHPNVSPAPGVSYPPNPRYKPKRDSDGEKNKKDRIVFIAMWHPERKVKITWTVDSRVSTVDQDDAMWSKTVKSATSGTMAMLRVENYGVGGFTHCSIVVNDAIIKAKEGDGWNSLMERDDAGDCVATVVVP